MTTNISVLTVASPVHRTVFNIIGVPGPGVAMIMPRSPPFERRRAGKSDVVVGRTSTLSALHVFKSKIGITEAIATYTQGLAELVT